MKKGYLLLQLHAHLPFVRHPESENYLEERWFFEAITETYIPLIETFDRFLEEQIPFRITMTITPTLSTMMKDELLKTRYLKHIKKCIKLAEKELVRTKKDPHLQHLGNYYLNRFKQTLEIYKKKYDGDLIKAFKKYQDAGCLEIITCGATHGFFPLMLPVQQSVRAQVATACEDYEHTFGRRPKGIWLPECGYFSGYDKILNENGLQYFFVDTHGVLDAKPSPQYGVYSPIRTPHGVHAFGRDLESSKQVWSAKEGYPGDVDYREYYRDIGFDLDWDYIKPHAHPDGIRINTGIKYHRITGENEWKEYYSPENARSKAASHAGNFMFNREKQVEHLYDIMGRRPVVVAPYDAELFGHWWYEGPMFIDFLVRKIFYDSPSLALITAPEYLEKENEVPQAEPDFSSWGYKGYAEYWLNETNDWIYPHLHMMSKRMQELARKFDNPSELERRALNQAAREVMLGEASDWAFILRTGTMVEYAVRRTKQHILNFLRLYEELMNGRITPDFVADLESKHNIFPHVNYRHYA